MNRKTQHSGSPVVHCRRYKRPHGCFRKLRCPGRRHPPFTCTLLIGVPVAEVLSSAHPLTITTPLTTVPGVGEST
jgi:hypothetical protein